MIWLAIAITLAIVRACLGITRVDGFLILILLIAVIGCIRVTRPAPSKKGIRK